MLLVEAIRPTYSVFGFVCRLWRSSSYVAAVASPVRWVLADKASAAAPMKLVSHVLLLGITYE